MPIKIERTTTSTSCSWNTDGAEYTSSTDESTSASCSDGATYTSCTGGGSTTTCDWVQIDSYESSVDETQNANADCSEGEIRTTCTPDPVDPDLYHCVTEEGDETTTTEDYTCQDYVGEETTTSTTALRDVDTIKYNGQQVDVLKYNGTTIIDDYKNQPAYSEQFVDGVVFRTTDNTTSWTIYMTGDEVQSAPATSSRGSIYSGTYYEEGKIKIPKVVINPIASASKYKVVVGLLDYSILDGDEDEYAIDWLDSANYYDYKEYPGDVYEEINDLVLEKVGDAPSGYVVFITLGADYTGSYTMFGDGEVEVIVDE